jgi:hypothetical protein
MPEVRRTLSRLPRPTAERILDKIELYAAEPQALANNVKRLKGDQASDCASAIGGFCSTRMPRR